MKDPEKSGELKATLDMSHRRDYTDEVVVLAPAWRTVLWVLVLALVFFNASLLATFAWVYFGNARRDSLLWLFRIFFLFSDGNKFLQESSVAVAIGYAVLCAIFAAFGLRMVWLSLSKGRVRFGVGSQRFSSAMSTVSSFSSFQVRAPRLFFLKTRLLALNHALGVRGPYFDVRLLLDEIFELSSQSVAAYSSSRSISNTYLNISYSVVIFVNSISSVVFRRIFKESLVKQRMACLLTDLVLDFVWGTLLPIWMYMPIVNIYRDREHVYDYIDNYANASREIERVLILSWKSYALSVIPFINALLNLAEIQSILHEYSGKQVSALSPRVGVKVAQAQAAPSSGQRRSRGSRLVLKIRHAAVSRRKERLFHVLHLLVACYGVAVLLITLSAHGGFQARTPHPEFDCLHPVNPWFTTKEACIGRRINCTSVGISGVKSELDAALEIFDETSLSDLFLTGCTSLQLTGSIQQFSRLQSLVIQESTITEWGASASLDAAHFQELRTVNLNGVHATSELEGLATEPISRSIEWIHLNAVDGPRIMANVGANWQHLLYFDCMQCGLVEFPDAITHMYRLVMLSLWTNNLTVIPDWPQHLDLQMQAFWIAENPGLSNLPDGVWRQAASLGIFAAAYTNLSVVPDWLPQVASAEFQLAAYATPLCADGANLPTSIARLVSCDVW